MGIAQIAGREASAARQAAAIAQCHNQGGKAVSRKQCRAPRCTISGKSQSFQIRSCVKTSDYEHNPNRIML
jgi:hypothetical protein